DLTLVGLDRALILAHERLLRVDLLLRDRILRQQRTIALEIDLGIREKRLVLGHLPLCVRQLYLERPRIDLGQQIALLHGVALAESQANKLTIDTASHDDHVARRDGTEAVEVDIDAAFFRRRGDDRQRAPCLVGPAASALRRRGRSPGAPGARRARPPAAAEGA